MTNERICQTCEDGRLHYAVRDVEIVRKGYRSTVPQVAGFFCDNCDDIDFDDNTDSAERYAAAGDELILHAREAALEKGKRLKKARISLALTQTQAAELTGGGHNAFSRYENGVVEPMPAVVNLFTLLENHPELLREIVHEEHS